GLGIGLGGEMKERAQGHPPEETLVGFLVEVTHAFPLVHTDQPSYLGVVQPTEYRSAALGGGLSRGRPRCMSESCVNTCDRTPAFIAVGSEFLERLSHDFAQAKSVEDLGCSVI